MRLTTREVVRVVSLAAAAGVAIGGVFGLLSPTFAEAGGATPRPASAVGGGATAVRVPEVGAGEGATPRPASEVGDGGGATAVREVGAGEGATPRPASEVGDGGGATAVREVGTGGGATPWPMSEAGAGGGAAALLASVVVTDVDLLGAEQLQVTVRFTNTAGVVEHLAGFDVLADGRPLARRGEPAGIDLRPGASAEETVAFAAPPLTAVLTLVLGDGERLPLQI